MSIVYKSLHEESQILTNPSSPPVKILMTPFDCNWSVTRIQLIAPSCAASLSTKCFPEQKVVISPRLVPKRTSDWIEWPSLKEMKSMHMRIETRGCALVSCFIVSNKRWLAVLYLLKCLQVKWVPLSFQTAICSSPHVIICFLLYGLNLNPKTGRYPVFLNATVLPCCH